MACLAGSVCVCACVSLHNVACSGSEKLERLLSLKDNYVALIICALTDNV